MIEVCFPLGYVDLMVSKIVLSCLSCESLSALKEWKEVIIEIIIVFTLDHLILMVAGVTTHSPVLQRRGTPVIGWFQHQNGSRLLV